MRVVGFEGHHWDAPLTFGAAATTDGEAVYNAVLGSRCQDGEWDRYVAEKVATRVDGSPEIDGGPCDHPYVLMRIRLGAPALAQVVNAAGTDAVAVWKDEGHMLVLFRSFERMEELTQPLGRPLYDAATCEDERRAASTLDHRIVLERLGIRDPG